MAGWQEQTDGGGNGQRGAAWRRDRARWYKSNARVLTVLTRGEGGVRARKAMGSAGVELAARAENLRKSHCYNTRGVGARDVWVKQRAGANDHVKARLGVKLKRRRGRTRGRAGARCVATRRPAQTGGAAAKGRTRSGRPPQGSTNEGKCGGQSRRT